MSPSWLPTLDFKVSGENMGGESVLHRSDVQPFGDQSAGHIQSSVWERDDSLPDTLLKRQQQ